MFINLLQLISTVVRDRGEKGSGKWPDIVRVVQCEQKDNTVQEESQTTDYYPKNLEVSTNGCMSATVFTTQP